MICSNSAASAPRGSAWGHQPQQDPPSALASPALTLGSRVGLSLVSPSGSPCSGQLTEDATPGSALETTSSRGLWSGVRAPARAGRKGEACVCRQCSLAAIDNLVSSGPAVTMLAAAALRAHGFQHLAHQVLKWLMACAALLSSTALCVASGQGPGPHPAQVSTATLV